jgi:hypothetical protein
MSFAMALALQAGVGILATRIRSHLVRVRRAGKGEGV